MSKYLERPEAPVLAANAYFASLLRRNGLSLDDLKRIAAERRQNMGERK